ncbi:MAG: hypothetical protein RIR91_1596 [Verrucomicrobiota bacterium]|jgi:hypothetical protein
MARKLEVELNAKSNADVVFGRAQRAASKFAGEIGNRIMGAVAPMVLFDKGMNAISGAIDKYADANARARKLGVPFSEFFQLSEALDDAGISEETTAKAVKEMQVVLAEAQGGVETQVKALKDLGFTQEQISKGSINVIDLFMKLADATKAARSEAERNNVVLTILGKKTGPELANALSAGSAELRKNMGDASKATDDMGQRAEDTRIFWKNFGDEVALSGMNLLKWAANAATFRDRFIAVNEAMKTAKEGKLDDAQASELLARALIEQGKALGMTTDQMIKDLQSGKGELADFYAATQDAFRSPLGRLPEDAERGKRLTQDVLDNAKKILDLRKQAAAADSTAKPSFQQFSATTMQALGGGYANARAGGGQSQPIGALLGTTPLLPSTTSPTTPSEQIFQDIRSMVNSINGKIETPSTNQTNPHFRLSP